MRSLVLAICLLFLGVEYVSAQGGVMVYEPGSRSASMQREIKKGKGQEFDTPFVDFQSYHFVQFAVYPASADRYELFAPSQAGQAWLIFHEGTVFEDSPERGAYYIVKPFTSEEEARENAELLKKKGVDCWYNGELTDARFILVAISFPEQ